MSIICVKIFIHRRFYFKKGTSKSNRWLKAAQTALLLWHGVQTTPVSRDSHFGKLFLVDQAKNRRFFDRGIQWFENNEWNKKK